MICKNCIKTLIIFFIISLFLFSYSETGFNHNIKDNDITGSAVSQAGPQQLRSVKGPKVRVVYLIPKDRQLKINNDYIRMLTNAIKDVRTYYYYQTNGNTFKLNSPIIEYYKTSHTAKWYSTNPNGETDKLFYNNGLEDAAKLAGAKQNDPENIWIIYVDAPIGCDQEIIGTSGVSVLPENYLLGLVEAKKFNCKGEEIPEDELQDKQCRWVGGLAYFLGKALNLDYAEKCKDNENDCGNPLMNLGYLTYPQTGLTQKDKEKLSESKFFEETDNVDTGNICYRSEIENDDYESSWIELIPGWNLISNPLKNQIDYSTGLKFGHDEFLSCHEDLYAIHYNSEKEFLNENGEKEYGAYERFISLEDIDYGKGYWVYLDPEEYETCSLLTSGSSTNQKVKVQDLGDLKKGKLKKGWNHIGSTLRKIELSKPGNCEIESLYWYDPEKIALSSDGSFALDDDGNILKGEYTRETELKPNKGYFIKVKDDCDLLNKDIKKWNVLVYLDADNNLARSIMDDFNEIESVGSSKDVNILVQLDRSEEYEDYTYPDWTTTKRLYLERDTNMYAIKSRELEDLGEIDMADPKNLYEFLKWADENYPAKRTILLLNNHGGGWKGLLSDEGNADYYQDDTEMSLEELKKSLERFNKETGKKIDIIAFDMCLMGQLEVDNAISEFASIRVGSEELIPGEGYDYFDVMDRIKQDPEISTEEVAIEFVESYHEYYDKTKNQETTISAVRLDKIKKITELFAKFSEESNNDIEKKLKPIIKSLKKSEAYDKSRNTGYVDLYGFLDNYLKEVPEDENAKALKIALDESIIKAKNGLEYPESKGISFYFPENESYFDKKGYFENSTDFAITTKWDETLDNIYKKRAEYHEKTAPSLAIKNKEVTLKPDQNKLDILYIFSGYDLFDVSYQTWMNIDEDSFLLELDYARIKDKKGDYIRPTYQTGDNNLILKWTSETKILTNDKDETFITLESYDGKIGKYPTYYTYGKYISQSGEENNATIIFNENGNTVTIYGYQLYQGDLLPFEITPNPEDEFIPYREYVTGKILYEEGKMKFKEGLTLKRVKLPAGEYNVYLSGTSILTQSNVDDIKIKIE